MRGRRGALTAAIIAAAGTGGPIAAASIAEADVQACVCAGMAQEWSTKAGTRVDCLSAEFAIEVDRSEKWAEAIGQSLHYAAETEKRPKIILFCAEADPGLCNADAYRLEGTIAYFDLPITVDFISVADLKAECPGDF